MCGRVQDALTMVESFVFYQSSTSLFHPSDLIPSSSHTDLLKSPSLPRNSSSFGPTTHNPTLGSEADEKHMYPGRLEIACHVTNLLFADAPLVHTYLIHTYT